MENGNGWISLHRKIQDHWLFTEERKFSKFEAWLDLLLLANHKDGKTMFKNELVQVKRGQHVTSIRKLCKRWGWSNTKVKKFLSLLEEENMIQVQNDSKKTVVTIVNYELYQSDDLKKRHQQIENEEKTRQKNDTENALESQENQDVSLSDDEKKRRRNVSEATQKHTNNNDNNSFNNGINNNPADEPFPDPFEIELTEEQKLEVEIEEHYQIKRLKIGPVSPKDRDLIKQAIYEEKFTREEIISGINEAVSIKGPNGINSFEYCLKVMRTQRDRKQKETTKRKIVPLNRRTDKPDELPMVLRPEFQQQHQKEMSAEEFEAQKRAFQERVRRFNEKMPKVGEQ